MMTNTKYEVSSNNAVRDYYESNAFRRHLNKIIDARIRLALEEE